MQQHSIERGVETPAPGSRKGGAGEGGARSTGKEGRRRRRKAERKGGGREGETGGGMAAQCSRHDALLTSFPSTGKPPMRVPGLIMGLLHDPGNRLTPSLHPERLKHP